MRWLILALCAGLSGACANTAIAPTPPQATFSWRLVSCPLDTPQTMIDESPCKETGEVVGTPPTEAPRSFTVSHGKEYQFQLSVTHPHRANCRDFGNVSMTRTVSAHVVTFNRTETEISSPFYFGGLRFIAETPGTYNFFVQATSGCDLPAGTSFSVIVPVTLLVE